MDYPYRDNNISAGEVIGLVFVFLMLAVLIGTVVYFGILHPSQYEYEKDGETYSADYCYTGRTDEFICEVDGRRFHVNTYRRYKKGE